MSTPSSVLIAVPTYNEAENVEAAVLAVHHALPHVDVLVVDDSSPDGTGAIADRLAGQHQWLHVLHRVEKAGLGAAYVAAFRWGIDRGYDILGEFDADGSHPAAVLPRMLAELEADRDAALVIGSRWVRGGRVVDWPKRRELLSRGGNAYARVMLQIPVRDATGGFRLYRGDALRQMGLTSVASRGYCFQVDLTLRVHDSGRRIVEVPITFRERELGASKMSSGIVLEAMRMVTIWGIQRAIARALRLRRPAAPFTSSRGVRARPRIASDADRG